MKQVEISNYLCFILLVISSLVQISSCHTDPKTDTENSHDANQLQTHPHPESNNHDGVILNWCVEARPKNHPDDHENKNSAIAIDSEISSHKNNVIRIPEWLQAPLTPAKKEYLESQSQLNRGLFHFSAIYQNPECPNEENRTQLTFRIHTDVYRNESASFRFKLNNYGEYFTPSGHFFTYDYLLDTDKYCIVKINTTSITLDICFPDQSAETPKQPVLKPYSASDEDVGPSRKITLQKCCPPGSTMQLHSDYLTFSPSCIENPSSTEWSPDFYRSNDPSKKASEPHDVTLKYMPIHYICEAIHETGFDFLTSLRQSLKHTIADIRVLQSGKVVVRRTGNDNWDLPIVHRTKYIQDFCIDSLIDSATWPSAPVNYSNPLPEVYTMIQFCHEESREDFVYTYAQIEFAIYFPSLVLLFLIVIIYALVWNLQNVHGWTVATFSFSMFVWFLASVMASGAGLSGYDGVAAGSQGCIFIGVLNHFFYISTYCWMTILNFDLWSTITSMTPRSARRRGVKRYGIYCLIGFGVPTFVVIVALIIEHEFGLFDDRVIRPQYGHAACVLDKTGLRYYAILPNIILFVFNSIFAIFTLRFIVDYKQNSKHLDVTSKVSKKQLGIFFVRLFTLMGFTWVLELIPNLLANENDTTWYWTLFKVYNVLQAVGLFWIFALKKEIRDQLCQKYKIFEGAFKYLDSKLQSSSKTKQESTGTDASRLSDEQL